MAFVVTFTRNVGLRRRATSRISSQIRFPSVTPHLHWDCQSFDNRGWSEHCLPRQAQGCVKAIIQNNITWLLVLLPEGFGTYPPPHRRGQSSECWRNFIAA